jgi:hypothetical protein
MSCPYVDQVAIEVLGRCGNCSRVYANEFYVEVLGAGGIIANQEYVEVLGSCSSCSTERVSRIAVEVLGPNIFVPANVNKMSLEVLGPNPPVPVNVNHMHVQVLGPTTLGPVPAQVDEVAVEVLGKTFGTLLVNQEYTEVLGQTTPPSATVVNEVMLEVLGSSHCTYIFELFWPGGGTAFLGGSAPSSFI